MLIAVIAANANAAAWEAVQHLHSEFSAVVESIHLAIDHDSASLVYSYGAPIRQHWLHAVTTYGHAF